MKLTDSQKNQIYNKNMVVDDYEWVPCINHVLKVLGCEDSLECDENYEVIKWTGTKPLIKDEKIRKAVRAWAEALGADEVSYNSCAEYSEGRFEAEMGMADIDFGRVIGLKDGNYTIAELCGEEEE